MEFKVPIKQMEKKQRQLSFQEENRNGVGHFGADSAI